MAQFTIIRDNSVWRVSARSLTHLTTVLHDLSIKWLGIHQDGHQEVRSL